MASRNYNSGLFDEEGKALYDLRQVRAKFISLHLLAIDEASRKRDYQEWLRNVRLLYTFVEHFLISKNKKVRGGNMMSYLKKQLVLLTNIKQLISERIKMQKQFGL